MASMTVVSNWVLQGKSIKVENGNLVKSSFCNRIHYGLSKSYKDQEIQKVAAYILSQLDSIEEGEAKPSLIALADAFVRQNHKSEHIKPFDRKVACHRPKIAFCHQANQVGFLKWQRNGLPPEIYQKYPEFCRFLEDSKILSQMKVTRDTLTEIDGEPALTATVKENGKLETKWMKWSELQKKFEFVYSQRYRETFVVKKDTSEVFTYLDNGLGLQLHHPFLSERTPISTLNDEQYGKVLAKANEFIRPGEENLSEEEREERNTKRTFVLQLVSSYVKGPNTNFHEMLSKPQHPYIRLVIGESNPEMSTSKGQVYEVGYVRSKKKVFSPLMTTKGQFRSPDTWEYNPCESRVVTNIPITKDEATALNAYSTKYHRNGINLGNPIGFHITRQNCTSFIHVALHVVGVGVQTEILLVDLIKEITPDCIKQIGRLYQNLKKGIAQIGHKIFGFIPECIKNTASKVRKVFKSAIKAIAGAAVAFSVAILRLPLGGAKGKGGQAFVHPNAPPQRISSDANDLKTWYKLSSYRINLPGVIQRWQRKQASTVVYDNPVRLTIVP